MQRQIDEMNQEPVVIQAAVPEEPSGSISDTMSNKRGSLPQSSNRKKSMESINQ